MAGNSLTIHNPSVPVSSAPRFTDFSSNSDSLVTKISLVFGLFLAAGVTFCLYNISRCYQFIRNPSFQLNDEFKHTKCEILLDEIQEKLNNDPSADVTGLLQECEALQNSMTYHKSVTILLKLVHHYSTIDSKHAYQIAQDLPFEAALFSAATSIQKAEPTFDHVQLSALFQKAFQLLGKNHKIPASMLIINLLMYVKVFHSLQEDTLKNQALDQAIEIAGTCENKISQINLFCKIAKILTELNLEQPEKMKGKIQDLHNATISQTEHLALAAFFSLNNESEKMNEALEKISNPSPVEACALTLLLKKISANDKIQSKFKDLSAVGPILNQAFKDLEKESNAEKKASAYLTIASTCEEFAMHNEMQEALSHAMEIIESLPEGTAKEIKSKFNLFSVISFYKQMSKEMQLKVLEHLKKWYNFSSFDKVSKHESAECILSFCNTNNLTKESEQFFTQYLSDLINNEKDAQGKVLALTTWGTGSHFSHEQRKLVLETAEKFISQFPFFAPSLSYENMIARIAKGYVKVDRQKSVELLTNYTNSRAMQHFSNAVTTMIAVGILFTPLQESYFLLPALTLYQAFRLL